MRVIAAAIERDGKVLIGKRRKDEKRFANKWEFPGGKCEDGETDEECLVRELFEECRVRIEVNRLIDSNVHNYNGLEVRLFLYHCTADTDNISSLDHDELKWVEVEKLRAYDFLEADLPLLPVVVNYFS
ncbi:MAG: (deoxy)nucleoside triphosphate pyrophosphohydrolase [Candidatus Omnitrophica bacterium]|nr:(deoxy)nucleoside triphosphate pyrophosphohydrolase [Candidatus Omnitrophota bacterium]